MRFFCFFVSLFLTASAMAAPKTFTLPSGQEVAEFGCRSKADKCYKKATKYCKGGSYQVVDSWSNSGGLLADIAPGPYTWYHMQVACGPSDGELPSFALREKKKKQSFWQGLEKVGKAMEQAGSVNDPYNVRQGGAPVARSGSQNNSSGSPSSCNLVSQVSGKATSSLSLNNNSGIAPATEPTTCVYKCSDGSSKIDTTQGMCPSTKWSNSF